MVPPMSKRHPNYRLVKIHRSYTVDEAARLLDAHKNTVRRWVKEGLATNDERRPMLILGRELFAFLKQRRAKNKRTCAPGEIYCVGCREPRRPAADMAEYQALTATLGNLLGICPSCEAMMCGWCLSLFLTSTPSIKVTSDASSRMPASDICWYWLSVSR